MVRVELFTRTPSRVAAAERRVTASRRAVGWRARAALMLVTGGLTWTAIASAAGDSFRNTGGVAIYLGVVPAAMVQGHPPDHPERKMHGGVASGRSQQHVLVAIFDASTGTRIEDAVVTAKVGEPGLAVVEKRLEPMPIAGAMSYGNYFPMAAPGPHRIGLRVLRPATGQTVEATFVYPPLRAVPRRGGR
jgi:hypothetical protein